MQETKKTNYHTLENVEILIGVVGPAALGNLTQNDFHQFIGVDSALGWHNQIKNEPGFVLSYERKWRFQQPLFGNFAVDAIPEIGASGGNVLTYAEAGGMVRVGQNLAADYGPDRIRQASPVPVGSTRHNSMGNWGGMSFLARKAAPLAKTSFFRGIPSEKALASIKNPRRGLYGRRIALLVFISACGFHSDPTHKRILWPTRPSGPIWRP